MSRTSLSPLFLAAALAVGAAAAPSRADEAAGGKRLYRAKCSGCHRLHPKDEFTPEQWKAKLPEMGKRAKLTPDQLVMIGKYLGVPEEPAAAPTPTPASSQETVASHL